MKSDDIFKAAIDNSFDGILIADKDGNVVYINSSYEKISGLRKDEIINRNLKDLQEEGYFSISASMISIATGEASSTIHSYRSGKTALTNANPIYENGELVGVVNNTRNIHDLAEIENTIAEDSYEVVQMERGMTSLKSLLNKEYDFIFESHSMVETIKNASSVAPYDTTVLITGDSGTGKEVVARYIHTNSPRKEEAFIKVNCAAIPSELFESELFGYEKGAFTGARESGKVGMFELANKGTLLLDEIGELPLEMQSKLLRAIQEKKIQRLGSEESIEVDVRILASTNVDLEKAVEEGTFREDLYFRLSVFPVHINPLRERRDDIEPLINFFLERLNKKYKTTSTIDNDALEALKNYSYPGNVRELENIVEYLYVLSEDSINIGAIPGKVLSNVMLNTSDDIDYEGKRNLSDLVDIYEKTVIEDVIKKYKNLKSASEVMGIHSSTLSRKMKKYDLDF